jgi:microcystin-dependent protein
MSSPFLAEIKVWAGNFPPVGYAFCAGQLMPISQNTALFSLLGTIYGGDGRSTFALPNLQGAVPVHATNDGTYDQGAPGGSPTVTLLLSEIAVHNHGGVNVNQVDPANLTQPAPNRIISQSKNGNAFQRNSAQNMVPMSANAVTFAGGGAAHDNEQPFLALNYIIALQGVFPPRP